MYFKCFQFLYQHFMIGISSNQYNIIEFTEKRKFIGFQCKPHIDTFFYDSETPLFLYFA